MMIMAGRRHQDRRHRGDPHHRCINTRRRIGVGVTAAYSTKDPSSSNGDIAYSSSDEEGNHNEGKDMKTQLAMAKHTLLTVAASIMNVPPELFTTPPMVDPVPPLSSFEVERRQKVDDILSKGWESMDGYELSEEEMKLFNKKMKVQEEVGNDEDEPYESSPSTYGEITELGARQLFNYMNLYSDENDDGDGSNSYAEPLVFVDLGCGTGKLLIQAFMELPSLQKIIGVELAPSRCQIARNAWNNLQTEAKNARMMHGRSDLSEPKGCNVEDVVDIDLDIIQGDMFELDVSSVTHMYIASLCFTDDMMERLGEKLSREAKKLRCVASLKPFPESFHARLFQGQKGNEHDNGPKQRYIEMSWTQYRGAGSIVYFYHR